MGPRYVLFRLYYDLQLKSGLLKRKYPLKVELPDSIIKLDNWRSEKPNFFFQSKEDIKFTKRPSKKLLNKSEKIKKGIIPFFSSQEYNIGQNWLKNPDSGFIYPLTHWTEIPDFSKKTGDIKYVWEKSRFSYLLTIIRNDFHNEINDGEFVFDEIMSWINENPLNLGPNYRCSQEISIRILNWIFALYYYSNSEYLTEEKFKTIMTSIYGQMAHVYSNINFSRIAVRNNHAITETLCLYLVGLLMPFFPDSKKWKEEGKKWFEKEIDYQIYDDGTFLQFSMNYHRVLIQLLSWAFFITEKNGERFEKNTYYKANKSLKFLLACQIPQNGFLPNYGANDGALFFPLNDLKYRDYRGQLNPLYYFFNKASAYKLIEASEDCLWYTNLPSIEKIKEVEIKETYSFEKGGYYLFKDSESLTFIRCGNHKDRPSQADNLHIDIWVKGKNILRDAGSYKYNTEEKISNFFTGTRSHNTVMLGDNNQMLKKNRFIWFYWTQAISAKIENQHSALFFDGTIKAFQQINKNIIHRRQIKKIKNKLVWHVTDYIENKENESIVQIWNPSEYFFNNFTINCMDFKNSQILPKKVEGWYSSKYGRKKKSMQLVYETNENQINTTINENSVDSSILPGQK